MQRFHGAIVIFLKEISYIQLQSQENNNAHIYYKIIYIHTKTSFHDINHGRNLLKIVIFSQKY